MKAISFGEVLWDIIEGKEYLGGAPFNLAAHLAKLGCSSRMISRVGEDERGSKVLEEMKHLGVDPSFMQKDKDHPTGTVNVRLSFAGEPEFTINKNAAYDFIEFDKKLEAGIKEEKFDAFCFGTLAQRSDVTKKTLYTLLGSVNSNLFFYDVNLRQKYYSKEIINKSLSVSGIVKLNDDEAKVLPEIVFNKKMDEKEFATELCRGYRVKIVCVTRGGNGCAVYSGGEFREIPGIKVKVIDTVGSGDAFSAGFLFKHCSGKDPFEAAEFANRLGAFVASKRGAIPDYDLNYEL